jgi:hypothetical protein
MVYSVVLRGPYVSVVKNNHGDIEKGRGAQSLGKRQKLGNKLIEANLTAFEWAKIVQSQRAASCTL